MEKTFLTKNPQETEALAEKLLPEILNKKIVLLSGDLGAGKTTFVKGLAKALGVEKIIKSPTYTYLNRYEIKKQGNKEGIHSSFPRFLVSSFPRTLYHFDLYRLPEKSPQIDQTAASIGLTEAIEDAQGLVLIEWPERLPLHISALHLNFKKTESLHQITMS